MSGDRWRRVNDLFHQASDLPEDGRAAFLRRECGDDDALREEVTSLLGASGRSEAFLEGGIETESRPTIGQYQVERVLGRGGMGVVYLAFDPKLRRNVALKAVSPEYTHDPVRRERLRREAQAAASLKHPGIAIVYTLEEFGDQAFIVTEYVQGETLREEVSRGPVAPERVLDTAIALASALAAAHDGGVVHRDLKPENVIRESAGGIKILDFGLAQMTVASTDVTRLTVEGRVLGTPAYMAPEQIRREPCDGRTDLFGLGVLIFEMLAGAHPFTGQDTASTLARILETSPELPEPGPSASDRRIRQELRAIVRRCMAKSPEGRYGSAHDLHSALQAVRRGESVREEERQPETDPAMRWWEFHQGAACFSYAVLMVPLWLAHTPMGDKPGLLVFLAGLLSTVAAVVLRLHLWFAASSLPEEWREQRKQSHPFLRTAEWVLVGTLAVAGVGVLTASAALGAVLLSAAMAVLLSFTVIEPATTRAAFRRY